MIRRLLTYQLILVVAVGPLLCCCTVERLRGAESSSPVSTNKTDPSPQTAPTETARASHSCCGHKKQKAEKPKHDNKSPEQHPLEKPGEKCPCKGKTTEQANVVAADGGSLQISAFVRAISVLDQPFGVFLHTTPPTLSLGVCGNAGDLRTCSATRLSTEDLLFVHHNLRC